VTIHYYAVTRGCFSCACHILYHGLFSGLSSVGRDPKNQESGGTSDHGDMCWGCKLVCYMYSCLVVCMDLELVLFILYAVRNVYVKVF
jgi:hypothetical protein